MTVLQQAHLYVDQLRREANKTRINVSEAIQDMMVKYKVSLILSLRRPTICGPMILACED